ncbi:hypothetical protein [Marinobacter nauticus]|uniref:hypothetical protein n=1 Tax=Marinobacter nauticus TaxID=2743 RepID=UPI00373637F4
MSNSAILAANVAIMASVEESQRKEQCGRQMEGYQHDTASIEESRQYADCVDLLHPDPMTAGEVFVIKVFLCWMLLGAVVNLVYQKVTGNVYSGLDYIMFPFLGAIAGAAFPAFFYLIKFIFS